MPVTDKVDVGFQFGPSIFLVSQDLPVDCRRSRSQGRHHFDLGQKVDKTTSGIHFGVDFTYLVTPRIGVGVPRALHLGLSRARRHRRFPHGWRAPDRRRRSYPLLALFLSRGAAWPLGRCFTRCPRSPSLNLADVHPNRTLDAAPNRADWAPLISPSTSTAAGRRPDRRRRRRTSSRCSCAAGLAEDPERSTRDAVAVERFASDCMKVNIWPWDMWPNLARSHSTIASGLLPLHGPPVGGGLAPVSAPASALRPS